MAGPAAMRRVRRSARRGQLLQLSMCDRPMASVRREADGYSRRLSGFSRIHSSSRRRPKPSLSKQRSFVTPHADHHAGRRQFRAAAIVGLETRRACSAGSSAAGDLATLKFSERTATGWIAAANHRLRPRLVRELGRCALGATAPFRRASSRTGCKKARRRHTPTMCASLIRLDDGKTWSPSFHAASRRHADRTWVRVAVSDRRRALAWSGSMAATMKPGRRAMADMAAAAR